MVLGVLYYVVFHGSELTFIGDYNNSFVVLFPIFKARTGDFFTINTSKKYTSNLFTLGSNLNYETLIKEKYLLRDQLILRLVSSWGSYFLRFDQSQLTQPSRLIRTPHFPPPWSFYFSSETKIPATTVFKTSLDRFLSLIRL